MLTDSLNYAALIGIDWSDTKHDLCLYDCHTQTFEEQTIGSRPEAIEALIRGLQKRFGSQLIAICLEQKRGPLVYALSKYDFLVLYPINPQTVAKYRQAFAPSRAKDDPTDAQLQVELLLKHRDKLTSWYPASPELRKLQYLVEWRRKWVSEVGRITNRLVAVLKGYFPQILDWFEDRDTWVFCDFLTEWPTLTSLQQVSDEQLERFFMEHNCRYKSCNTRRIEQIRASIPLTEDTAIIEPSVLIVKTLVTQLRALLGSLKEFESLIELLFQEMPDADLFADLPGAGDNLAPRLLLAFGEDRARYGSAQELLQYAGLAPVTERSGKKKWVHWRWSCPTFLRQTFVEWANESRKYSFWASEYYKKQKKEGKTHQQAMRALAFKWVRILYRCWQDRKPYDVGAACRRRRLNTYCLSRRKARHW